MDKRDIKSISDLNLVAYLICLGFKDVALPQREDRHIYFYFKDTPELQEALRASHCRCTGLLLSSKETPVSRE